MEPELGADFAFLPLPLPNPSPPRLSLAKSPAPANPRTHARRSGSMEPAFYRGDLLFLTNPADQRYQTGDITVYKIPGADIPIVHRVLETHDFVAKDKG